MSCQENHSLETTAIEKWGSVGQYTFIPLTIIRNFKEAQVYVTGFYFGDACCCVYNFLDDSQLVKSQQF